MNSRYPLLLAATLTIACASASAQVPAALLGKWRVEKLISTQHQGCWDADRARTLIGSTLIYEPHRMVWRDGPVPLNGLLAVVRTLGKKQYAAEYSVTFDELAIRTPSIREVDLQHEDADVTGSTTEVPGDTVVLAGPGRIVVSACGVYYQAVR